MIRVTRLDGSEFGMPSFIEFRTGQQVAVMPGHSMRSASYPAVIRQVADEGLRIDRPRRGGQRLELHSGDDVTLVLQQHGRMYTCTSRVLEVRDVPEQVLIEHPTAVRHNERRQFYRLLTNIAPRYAARISSDAEELERLDARIVDLSGGGVQLRVEQWLPVGSRVRLIFALEQEPLEIDVTVLALAVQRPDTRRSYYRVNAKYLSAARAMQERIIRYIFRQQMLLRQKQAV